MPPAGDVTAGSILVQRDPDARLVVRLVVAAQVDDHPLDGARECERHLISMAHRRAGYADAMTGATVGS